MNPIRKWLYVKVFNLSARIAPPEVRAIQNEVIVRGMKAYDDARKIEVPLREDLR